MPSPTCEVRDGAGPYHSTDYGVDITPGNVVTIRLADQTDVDSWTIACLTTDELSDKAAINASLAVDSATKTATFTAPADFGRTLRFVSRINNGKDANFIERDSYTTTFCIYAPTSGGLRVLAADERLEGDPDFGWITTFNVLSRNPSAVAPGGVAGEVQVNDGLGAFGAASGVQAGTNNITIAAGGGFVSVGGYLASGSFITAGSYITAATHIAVGPGAMPTTGYYRLGHSATPVAQIVWNANGSDISLLTTDGTAGTWRLGSLGSSYASIKAYELDVDAWTTLIVRHAGGAPQVQLGAAATDFVSFGAGTMPSTGHIRLPYNGGVSAVPVIQAIYSDGSTTKNFLSYGAGNIWTLGNTAQNLYIDSYTYQLVALSGGIANYHNTGFDIFNYTRSAYDLRINATGFNLKTKPGGKAADRTTIGHRLTLTTVTSLTTADVTGATTIYLTPHVSNQIALYDGTDWWQYEVDEISLALGTLTSGRNYDVFVYDNSGTVTLELTAWTNDSTRATLLIRQDGVWSKMGSVTKRYVGTIRTTSTTTTEDSVLKRYVWNMYNRVERFLYAQDTTASWAYSGAAWRQVRATSTNKVEAVFGLAGPAAGSSFIMWNGASGTGVALYTSIGIDSTTVASATVTTMLQPTLVAQYWWPSSSVLETNVAAGYHAFNWLEYAHATGLTGMGTVGFSQAHIRMRLTM